MARSETRNPVNLESCVSPQLFSCVRTRNGFKYDARELMITKHSDLDSSSGGCSTTQFSACLVGEFAHGVQDFSVLPFNLLKDVECSTWISGLQVT